MSRPVPSPSMKGTIGLSGTLSLPPSMVIFRPSCGTVGAQVVISGSSSSFSDPSARPARAATGRVARAGAGTQRRRSYLAASSAASRLRNISLAGFFRSCSSQRLRASLRFPVATRASTSVSTKSGCGSICTARRAQASAALGSRSGDPAGAVASFHASVLSRTANCCAPARSGGGGRGSARAGGSAWRPTSRGRRRSCR